jgi:putative ABC transport system ATP-binding protein
MTLIETLNREQGQTFVIVTHDNGVGRRCDRLVRMSDGEIVGEERN